MTALLIVLIVFFAPFTSAQEPLLSTGDVPVEAVKAVGIEVLPGITVSEQTADLKDVFFGGTVKHQFTITNTGETPVEIINIRTDCGCSSKLENQDPIAPGNSRILNVTYEPEYRTGDVTKRITIYTDIKSEGEPGKWFELMLKASIQSVVKVEPGHIYFKKVLSGETARESMAITSLKGAGVELLKAENSSEHLVVDLVSVSEDMNHPAWRLDLTLKETAPVGRFTDIVVLTTNSEQQKTINVDVLGFVRGTVSVRPTQCYLGTLTPGEVIKRTLRVVQRAEEADLKKPVIEEIPEWMSYTVTTETEGKHYNIDITFIVPAEKTGRFGGTFTITVDHPSLDTFEVPVSGYVLDSSFIKKEGSTPKPDAEPSKQ